MIHVLFAEVGKERGLLEKQQRKACNLPFSSPRHHRKKCRQTHPERHLRCRSRNNRKIMGGERRWRGERRVKSETQLPCCIGGNVRDAMHR